MGVRELTREATAQPKPTIAEQIEDLLNAHEVRIYGYLRNLLGDPQTAQDCVQEAYLRAVEHLARGKSVNAAWLYKVARNRALDHLRQKKTFNRDRSP